MIDGLHGLGQLFFCNPENSRLELFDVVYDGNC